MEGGYLWALGVGPRCSIACATRRRLLPAAASRQGVGMGMAGGELRGWAQEAAGRPPFGVVALVGAQAGVDGVHVGLQGELQAARLQRRQGSLGGVRRGELAAAELIEPGFKTHAQSQAARLAQTLGRHGVALHTSSKASRHIPLAGHACLHLHRF